MARSKLKKLLFSLVVLAMLIPFLLVAILHVYTGTACGSAQTAEDYFSKVEQFYKFSHIQLGERPLRYIKTGRNDTNTPLFLFVHGAPGSWEAFKSYLADKELQQIAQLIAVDRFGYGESDYGRPVTDIATHAAGINEVIKANPANKVILIGHSYGGAVIAETAAKYPNVVDGLLLIAPVIDPDSEPVKWYAHLANLAFSKSLLPDYINVCTSEKMNHIQALKDIQSDWSRISVPVIHYHGITDVLAPYDGNVKFSRRYIDESLLTVITEEDEGHFILWDKKETVKKMLLSLLDLGKKIN